MSTFFITVLPSFTSFALNDCLDLYDQSRPHMARSDIMWFMPWEQLKSSNPYLSPLSSPLLSFSPYSLLFSSPLPYSPLLSHFPPLPSPSLLTLFSSPAPYLLPSPLCHAAVPGYWLSVQYLERVGRKNVQMMGFCMMGILFLICGIFRDWFLQEGAPFSRKILFLVLYSLTFLFR